MTNTHWTHKSKPGRSDQDYAEAYLGTFPVSDISEPEKATLQLCCEFNDRPYGFMNPPQFYHFKNGDMSTAEMRRLVLNHFAGVYAQLATTLRQLADAANTAAQENEEANAPL